MPGNAHALSGIFHAQHTVLASQAAFAISQYSHRRNLLQRLVSPRT